MEKQSVKTKATIEKEALEKENKRIDNEIIIAKIEILKLVLEAYVYDKNAPVFGDEQKCVPVIEDEIDRGIIIQKLIELIKKL
jgi:protein-tyrosine phosphatase